MSSASPEPTRLRLRKALATARDHSARRMRALKAAPVQGLKMRVHGNLQLRKILLVADDFVITDFGGIPGMPLEERRQKQSPLADVARLLLSLRQAAFVAMERTLNTQPDLRERVEPAFEDWYSGARAAFLKGYRAAIAASHAVPDTADGIKRLLYLFELNSALRNLKNDLDRASPMTVVAIDALSALLRE